MLGVYYLEERLKILTRQGKISFLASTRGHGKVQVGTVMLMKPRHDWFFPYYRADSQNKRHGHLWTPVEILSGFGCEIGICITVADRE
jgi:TPP-dependent pyruvate/acetoin dehydrogenase alpha subunit